LEIALFCHEILYCKAAMEGGCSAIVVDWECHGKQARQSGFDTEISEATHHTLSLLRKSIPGRLVTRINNEPGLRRHEAQLAIELGSDEIWLPMVRSVDEIKECLEVLEEKIGLGIQVETNEALTIGRQLEQLPLTGVYIGLNDLRIDRGGHEHLFSPLVDGTLDRFRDTYSGRLGVAGITAPDYGDPIPQRLLLAAMGRLGCTFGVARRSFRRDVSIANINAAVQRVQIEYEQLKQRAAAEIASDHLRLLDLVSSLSRGRTAG
jgi:hypothetical protein